MTTKKFSDNQHNCYLFDLGICEVTPSAGRAIKRIGIDPESLFERHRCGDWGTVEDHYTKGNEYSIQQSEPVNHAITSRYVLADRVEVRVVTAMSRTRTRLQLDQKYQNITVTSAEGYAIWASEYNVTNILAVYEEKVVHPIINVLSPIRSVVDIGTGIGRYALHFAETVSRVVGVDESKEMLSVAHRKAQDRKLTNVEWIQATLGSSSLPLCSGSFDLLVSALMLSHVENLMMAISECVCVVRSGGTIIFTRPYSATPCPYLDPAFQTE